MAHFFGLASSAGKKGASSTGTKDKGIVTIAASWRGAIKVCVDHENGDDIYRVTLITWPAGEFIRELASGKLEPSGDA